jgi:hypothetical protein
MNFDNLEVCVKENALIKKKDLVRFKVKSEDIYKLFGDHSEFPKCAICKLLSNGILADMPQP